MPDTSTSTTEVSEEGSVNYFILTIGILISLAIFSAQITVFVTFYRKRSLTLTTDYFIASLALADTLVSVICVPGWTLQMSFSQWPLPMFLCDAWIVCDYSFCTISVYTVLFISFERFLGIRYPLRFSLKRSTAKTKVALCTLWAVASAVFVVFILYGQRIGQLRGQQEFTTKCEAHFLHNACMVF
ncbi:hypothetical protein CAPTEDRAFT_118440, partial [Capitella teleta]